MGLMDPEPMGNGTETPKLKGKYTRMDGDVNGEDEESPQDLGRKRGGRSESEKYVFASAVFASLNNVLLGYDVGVMSGVILFMKEDLIDATVYYSPTIFRDAGIESNAGNLAATIAVGVTKTAFILVAILLIDRVGRKTLLYVSTLGMTACLFGLGLSLSLLGHELVSPKAVIALAILAVCGNVAFFSVGIGPVCWVLTSEIFPLKVRAQASALGAVGNRLSSGLVAMSFLSMSRAISVAGVFFIFAAISAQSVVFVYYCVPETKGKSLEEIEVLFQHGRDQWQQSEVELEDVVHLVEKT